MITFDLVSMKQFAMDPKEVVAVAEVHTSQCEIFLRGIADPFVIKGDFYAVRKVIEDAT